MSIVQLVKLGQRVKYLPSLKIQQHYVDKVKNERLSRASCDGGRSRETSDGGTVHGGYLLVVEHSPVYTVGIRDRKLYAEEAEKVRGLGADFVQTNRGGLITFHGPGQLVAYPILDLRHFFGKAAGEGQRSKQLRVMGMRWYVETLEQTVMDTLSSAYDLATHRSPHTGVWTTSSVATSGGCGEKVEEEQKICAMGVHNSDLVTSHGLALNCDIDLSWFTHIVPCGIQDKGVTSLTQQLGKTITVEQALPHLIRHFEENFSCKVIT